MNSTWVGINLQRGPLAHMWVLRLCASWMPSAISAQGSTLDTHSTIAVCWMALLSIFVLPTSIVTWTHRPGRLPSPTAKKYLAPPCWGRKSPLRFEFSTGRSHYQIHWGKSQMTLNPKSKQEETSNWSSQQLLVSSYSMAHFVLSVRFVPIGLKRNRLWLKTASLP